MTDKRDIWKSRYYLILKTYMTISGLWPYRKLCDRYMHFLSIFILCSSILIPQLLYVLVASNINDVLESITAAIISITFSFKIAYIMFNNKNIRSCLKTIEEDWLSLNTDVEKSILQHYAKYGQHVMTFYAVLLHMVEVIYLLKPVVLTLLDTNVTNSTNSISKLPYRVEYGVDIDRYFYLITIHCYLAVFAHVFSTIAVDSLYSTLIQHACGMFAIIGHVLEKIGKNNNGNFYPSKIEDNDYRKALNCLRKHLQATEFAELIESTFTNIFLVSINLNIICGSIAGIQIMMNLNKDAGDVTGPLAIYVAQLVHIFLQYWQAQFLLDYSTIPYESICRGHWYYTSKRCQRLFLLIMIRSVSPCRITAGKIINLSIESFGTVLKTMMSYFMLLRSFQ